MTTNQTLGDVLPTYPVHPGVLLAEELEARGMSRKELAVLLGCSVRTVSDICNGRRAISANVALDLERALGVSAQGWLNLQSSYDLITARNRRTAQSA